MKHSQSQSKLEQQQFSDLFLKTILNETDFLKNYKQLILLLSSKQYYSKYQKMFIDLVKQVIKQPKLESKQKFLALYLLKQGLETKQILMIDYVRQKILRRLKIFGQFNPNPKQSQFDIEDGKLIFGQQVDKDYSMLFYMLNLEMIQNWNYCYYNKYKLKEYKIVYDELKKATVKFPDPFFYQDYHQQYQQNSRELLELKESDNFKQRCIFFIFQVQSIDNDSELFDLNQTIMGNQITNMSTINVNDVTSTLILNNDSRTQNNDTINRHQISYFLRNNDSTLQQNHKHNSDQNIVNIDLDKLQTQLNNDINRRLKLLNDRLIKSVIQQQSRLSGVQLQMLELGQKYSGLRNIRQKKLETQRDEDMIADVDENVQNDYKRKYQLLDVEIYSYVQRIKELEKQVIRYQQKEEQKELMNQSTHNTQSLNYQIHQSHTSVPHHDYHQIKQQNAVDQKVIQQLWETVNEKNKEIERQRQLIIQLRQGSNQKGQSHNIEDDSEDIYVRFQRISQGNHD